MEKQRIFLRKTASTAHLAILSRACFAGPDRDLGSLDSVNGGYLFAAIGAAISALRPRSCFLGPDVDLHDQPVRRKDRSRRRVADFCGRSCFTLQRISIPEMQNCFVIAG